MTYVDYKLRKQWIYFFKTLILGFLLGKLLGWLEYHADLKAAIHAALEREWQVSFIIGNLKVLQLIKFSAISNAPAVVNVSKATSSVGVTSER